MSVEQNVQEIIDRLEKETLFVFSDIKHQLKNVIITIILHEREACAKVAEEEVNSYGKPVANSKRIANKIRARGK